MAVEVLDFLSSDLKGSLSDIFEVHSVGLILVHQFDRLFLATVIQFTILFDYMLGYDNIIIYECSPCSI